MIWQQTAAGAFPGVTFLTAANASVVAEIRANPTQAGWLTESYNASGELVVTLADFSRATSFDLQDLYTDATTRSGIAHTVNSVPFNATSLLSGLSASADYSAAAGVESYVSHLIQASTTQPTDTAFASVVRSNGNGGTETVYFGTAATSPFGLNSPYIQLTDAQAAMIGTIRSNAGHLGYLDMDRNGRSLAGNGLRLDRASSLALQTNTSADNVVHNVVFSGLNDFVANLPALATFEDGFGVGSNSGETVGVNPTQPSDANFASIMVSNGDGTTRTVLLGTGTPDQAAAIDFNATFISVGADIVSSLRTSPAQIVELSRDHNGVVTSVDVDDSQDYQTRWLAGERGFSHIVNTVRFTPDGFVSHVGPISFAASADDDTTGRFAIWSDQAQPTDSTIASIQKDAVVVVPVGADISGYTDKTVLTAAPALITQIRASNGSLGWLDVSIVAGEIVGNATTVDFSTNFAMQELWISDGVASSLSHSLTVDNFADADVLMTQTGGLQHPNYAAAGSTGRYKFQSLPTAAQPTHTHYAKVEIGNTVYVVGANATDAATLFPGISYLGTASITEVAAIKANPTQFGYIRDRLGTDGEWSLTGIEITQSTSFAIEQMWEDTSTRASVQHEVTITEFDGNRFLARLGNADVPAIIANAELGTYKPGAVFRNHVFVPRSQPSTTTLLFNYLTVKVVHLICILVLKEMVQFLLMQDLLLFLQSALLLLKLTLVM